MTTKLTRAAIDRAAKTVESQQPRFQQEQFSNLVATLFKWFQEDITQTPLYTSEGRERARWLSQFWPTEPYLAGVINSVCQIDRNRGWSLVGGRNQVARFQEVLHNWEVQPGRPSWREGVATASKAFHTADIGGLIEVGRQFKDGPMGGMFHLDPIRCSLYPDPENPLRYYPTRSGAGPRMIEFTPSDFMRVVSNVNIAEEFNGMGYCALSRALELSILMVAILRHEQEALFARAPKGLLLLKGINQATWKNAMKSRDAQLEQREQEWFGSVAVLASAGMDDVDAKLFALSQLPDGFDQKVFTDLMMCGYALCFGYDVREFWPMSAGPLGSGTETITQARKASAKGGQEFSLGFQEELQRNLPPTLYFEFETRDTDAELAEAQLELSKMNVINSLRGSLPTGAIITDEQALELAAEEGIIPNEWTTSETEAEGSDTEETRQRMMEYPEVQRAAQTFPNENLVIYRYPQNRIQSLEPQNGRKVFDVKQVVERLIEEIKKEEPVIEQEIKPPEKPSEPPEEKFRIKDWLDLIREIGKPAHVVVNPPSPANVEVHNYMDGQSLEAINEKVEEQKALSDHLLEALDKIESPTFNIEAPIIPAPIVNVPAPVVQIKSDKPDETNAVLKAIRKLVNGRQ